MYDTYFDTAEQLIVLAALLVADDTGVGLDVAGEVVDRDFSNIVDLYQSRFTANFAAQGEAFGRDELFLSDLDTCTIIAQMVVQQVQGN
jgi:hypothetical protein